MRREASELNRGQRTLSAPLPTFELANLTTQHIPMDPKSLRQKERSPRPPCFAVRPLLEVRLNSFCGESLFTAFTLRSLRNWLPKEIIVGIVQMTSISSGLV